MIGKYPKCYSGWNSSWPTWRSTPQLFGWTSCCPSCIESCDDPNLSWIWNEGSQWRCSFRNVASETRTSLGLVEISPGYGYPALIGRGAAWSPDEWTARSGWRQNALSSEQRTRRYASPSQYHPRLNTDEHTSCNLQNGTNIKILLGYMSIIYIDNSCLIQYSLYILSSHLVNTRFVVYQMYSRHHLSCGY